MPYAMEQYTKVFALGDTSTLGIADPHSSCAFYVLSVIEATYLL